MMQPEGRPWRRSPSRFVLFSFVLLGLGLLGSAAPRPEAADGAPDVTVVEPIEAGLTPSPPPAAPAEAPWPVAPEPTLFDVLRLEAAGLAPVVLERALAALDCATREGEVDRPEVLTVIDYSLPSTAERLWVFDLERRELLYRERVAHGKNTGDDLAARFSNVPGSLQTSLGLFVTGATYHGNHGYSLRLRGLEPGINDRAFERAIVVHGAPYVSEAFVAAQGRLGRSWGCPAVRTDVARELIDTIKDGSAVYSFYPDEAWLGRSRFGETCGAAALAAPLAPVIRTASSALGG